METCNSRVMQCVSSSLSWATWNTCEFDLPMSSSCPGQRVNMNSLSCLACPGQLVNTCEFDLLVLLLSWAVPKVQLVCNTLGFLAKCLEHNAMETCSSRGNLLRFLDVLRVALVSGTCEHPRIQFAHVLGNACLALVLGCAKDATRM